MYLTLSRPRPRNPTSKTNLTNRRLYIHTIFKQQTTRHRSKRLLRLIRQRHAKGEIKQLPLRPMSPTKRNKHDNNLPTSKLYQCLLPITLTPTNLYSTMSKNTNTPLLHRPRPNRMLQLIYNNTINTRLSKIQRSKGARQSTLCTRLHHLLQPTNLTRYPYLNPPKTIRARRPPLDTKRGEGSEKRRIEARYKG